MKKAKLCGYSSGIVAILAIISGLILYSISEDAEDVWLWVFGMTFILGITVAIILFFSAAFVATRPEKRKEEPKKVEKPSQVTTQ